MLDRLEGNPLRSANEFIGLPVYDQITGKRLGKVRDLIVGKDWKVQGIVLDYKAWFTKARYAEWSDIASFGEDAIMVKSKSSISKYEQPKDVSFLCMGNHRIRGMPLITAEGVHLGRVEDVYFSQNMENSIIGFELTEGFLTDLREGRKRLPLPEGAERGNDVIMIPVHRLEEASHGNDNLGIG